MSDTHANAYRLEADEKRKLAADLNAQADALEAQAEELDPSPKPAKKAKAADKAASPQRDAKGHFVKEAK